MTDEAMKMARRIVNEVWESFGALSTKERAEKAALTAIIETQERDAALVERMIPMPGNPSQLHGTYAQGVFDAAAAIRSGQQFRKDGSGGGEYIRCTWIETTAPVDPWPNIKPPKGNTHD